MEPKISIIVPIYKVEKYLDKCIESIVNQTYRNLEIILVDDGSPDSCPRKCDEWAEKDQRIRVIHKKNAGLGFARNSGLEIASGEYVVFVDSDDYVSTKIVSVLFDAMQRTGADTVYCGLNQTFDDGHCYEISNVYEDCSFEGEDILNYILLRMLGNQPEQDNGKLFYMSVWHAMYSMQIINKYNIRFPSERVFKSEDISFHIDYLYRSKKVHCISDHLYYYRVNNESLSRKFDPESFRRLKILHDQIVEKLSDIMDKEHYHVIIEGWFLSRIRGEIMDIVKRKDRYPISKIRKITNDELVRKYIEIYPYHVNPKGRRVFNYLIDKKCNLILYFIVKAHLLRMKLV